MLAPINSIKVNNYNSANKSRPQAPAFKGSLSLVMKTSADTGKFIEAGEDIAQYFRVKYCKPAILTVDDGGNAINITVSDDYDNRLQELYAYGLSIYKNLKKINK